MEYNLTKKSLPQLNYALNTTAEQPVDIDLTLPDYCPDIERILCCNLIPKVYLANVNADRLNIEGASCVRVLYVDGDKGCVRSYEYSVPFSESLPLKDGITDCAVYVEAKPEYINCRALSPRKLSLHGAFSLCVKVAVSNDLDYYTYDNGEDLQVRGESIAASALCGLCNESFSVQEDIPVDSQSDINALLTHRLQARITELKAIHNKIMLNAELRLEMMYLADAEKREIECMSYNIPVSRVIDCEGVDENAVIDGRLDVLSADVRLSDDALDGSSVLGLDAKLCFNALCYAREEIQVLSDAFSTEREVDISRAPFSCVSGTVCRTYTDIGKARMNIEESIGRVIDIHCEKISVTSSVTDEAILLTAKVCAGILFENTEGDIRYVERDAEFTYRPDTEGCDCVESVRAAVDSMSYRMTDAHTIEIRAELCYRLTLSRRETCSAVSRISADDDAPVRECDGALILYYTDGEEGVWDISKRFCSRPEDIIAENGLSGETVERGVMLLIPTA